MHHKIRLEEQSCPSTAWLTGRSQLTCPLHRLMSVVHIHLQQNHSQTFTLPYLLAILLPLTIQLPPLVNVPTSLKHGPATAKQALLYREYWRGTLSKNIEMISSIQENSLLVNFWLDLMMLRFLHGRPISTKHSRICPSYICSQHRPHRVWLRPKSVPNNYCDERG